MPWTGGFIAGSTLTPVIARRIRPAVLMGGGLALAAVGYAMLTRVDDASGLMIIVAASIVFSIGLAPAFTLSTDFIIGSAPPEKAGAAAALSETASELGGALGIAILGSIGTAVYRRIMLDAVPAGLSSESLEAARGTLGGALGVSEELPARIGTQLVSTARAAFTQAFELTGMVCAIVALATGFIAFALLRRVQAGSQAEKELDAA